MELYRRSLDFEDIPDTRVDLAIADFRPIIPMTPSRNPARRWPRMPNNARAWNVRPGRSMKKGDYDKAAEAFDHVVRLNPDIGTLYSLGICLLQIKDASNKEKNSSEPPPCSSR